MTDSNATDPRGALVAEHSFGTGTVSMLVWEHDVHVAADEDCTDGDWQLAAAELAKFGITEISEPADPGGALVWEIKY